MARVSPEDREQMKALFRMRAPLAWHGRVTDMDSGGAQNISKVTRLRAALLLPQVGKEITDGVIEITGNRISYIGSTPSSSIADEEIDATAYMVIPAFVNTHAHTSQQLGRGLADDVDLLTWLRDHIWPYESALSPADAEISALACAAEQIRNGVTLLADPGGQHVEAMAAGIARSGIRAFVAASAMDSGEGLPPGWANDTEAVLALQDDLFRCVDGTANGRVRFSYTLRTIFNCSDDLIVQTRERSVTHARPLQMHIAEVAEENEYVVATRGSTTVKHLARLGVLGPGFVGAHAVWIDDAERDLLASSGAAVSHNVASNLRVLGIPKIADLVDAGCIVGLGTDGAPSNNRMSILDEMWAASMVQKAVRRDPTAFPSSTVLRMATEWGAQALGMGNELGQLRVGGLADLVVIDPMTPNMATAHDMVSALVTSCASQNVHSVMCDGTWVMRDRVITAFDERAVLREAAARANDVARRALKTH
jgi:5-methylthioadenosine/S-adenosylhomocysteine deaminase